MDTHFSFPKLFKHSSPTTQGLHTHSPQKLWYMLLLGVSVVIVGSGIWSVYLFTSISNDQFSTEETFTQKKSELINQKKLESVLQGFDQRKQTFDMVSTSGIIVPDPSL